MGKTGLKKHNVTAESLNNLMFGAGAFYKNLKLPVEDSGTWTGTPLGATSGGGGVNITPEYTPVELDGATVFVKNGHVKTGEVANMKMNMTEFTLGVVKDVLHLVEDAEKAVKGFKCLKTKAMLDEADYLENIAFVGRLLDGRDVVVIMENAICTGALELETENKKQGTYEITYECTANIEQDDLEHLPVYVYFEEVAGV